MSVLSGRGGGLDAGWGVVAGVVAGEEVADDGAEFLGLFKV
jgi:hypothetical protein